MGVGERIRWFRKRKDLTQRELGLKVGFTNKTADLRIRQYETRLRNPKEDTIRDLAQVFEVAEEALAVPDIDSYIGLMHTLFALEDLYGLTIMKIDGQVCLRPDVNHPNYSLSLMEDLNAWYEVKEQRQNGIMRTEEYDRWRYTYPKERAADTKEVLDRSKAKLKFENNKE